MIESMAMELTNPYKSLQVVTGVLVQHKQITVQKNESRVLFMLMRVKIKIILAKRIRMSWFVVDVLRPNF